MAHAPGDKPGGLVTVLTFSHVAFRYDTVAPEVFHDLSAAFPPGWTGVVGANGAGKTTLLRLALGELVPRCGTVRGPARRGWCPQRVETEPEALEAFLEAQDRTAARLRGILELEPSELRRWHILSPGERKRAQIAVALWEDPEVLLLDEPTNHVDASVRALLERALGTFRGVGLLVSHDRGLLDALTTQCLFLDPPQGALVPGNYSAASKVREETRQAAEGAFQIQRREVRRLEEAERRRKAEARSADRRCTKRHLAKGDADGRARMDLIRVSGKDGQAGRLQRQMEGRIRQSREVLEVLAVRKTPPLRFWLSGARSSRNRILDLPGFSLPLGADRTLDVPCLSMGPSDRVALVGPNGAGKSTLLGSLRDRWNLPQDRVLFLPQELSSEEERAVLRALRSLPPERRGLVGTVVRCLGSDPAEIFAGGPASPGELRKILLALGVLEQPHLLVLDEPTNHLDLPAVELLENALASCPCALLVVSHDETFLNALTTIRWTLEPHGHRVVLRRATSGESSTRRRSSSPSGKP